MSPCVSSAATARSPSPRSSATKRACVRRSRWKAGKRSAALLELAAELAPLLRHGPGILTEPAEIALVQLLPPAGNGRQPPFFGGRIEHEPALGHRHAE